MLDPAGGAALAWVWQLPLQLLGGWVGWVGGWAGWVGVG